MARKNVLGNEMTIRVSSLKAAAYIFLAVPIIVFFIGWLELWFSIPLSLGVAAAVMFAMRADSKEDIEQGELLLKGRDSRVLKIRRIDMLVIIELILVWVFFSGIGGYFYQSSDHTIRNAILRDLVNYDWPVYYPQQDTAMVYYIAFWLVPALFGKCVGLFTDANTAWTVANMALFLFTAGGILIVCLLFINKVKAFSSKRVFATLLILIFFSGMDILGFALAHFADSSWTFGLHLEWWNMRWQLSSNSTQLFWVFNQSTATWIVTMLFLYQKDVRNYAFLAALMVPYSPIPVYGLSLFLAVTGVKYFVEAIRDGRVLAFFKECLSLQNILAAICIVPLTFLYFTSNATVEDAGWNLSIDWLRNPSLVALFIIFLITEAGIFMALLFKEHKTNPIWYAMIVVFAIFPFIRLGYSLDFYMRSTIPALFILMVYITDYIFKHTKRCSLKHVNTDLVSVALIICLGIGCVTSVTEFRRGISSAVKTGQIMMPADTVITLNQPKDVNNFVSKNPATMPFFNLFAKELTGNKAENTEEKTVKKTVKKTENKTENKTPE